MRPVYFSLAQGSRSEERFAHAILMVNLHVRAVELECSTLGIAHRKLMNSMAQYRAAGPGSSSAEASHQKPSVMTPNVVAECGRLPSCGHQLARGFNRVYTQHFLQTLKECAAAKLLHFPGLFDERCMRQAATLFQFDDVVTGPQHGFAGADDYWRRASSKPWLNAIRLPTLVLNALNDPFLPSHALPSSDRVAAAVKLDYPREGGHVGFVSGRLPGRLDWLSDRLLHFFQQVR